MNNFINNCKAFMKDEEGLTVVEYVVGAGLLVAGLTGIFTTFSSTLTTELGSIFSSGS
ncbi:Flp family type IVb pilin [Vibrio gallaecicus]|uniref:Flp family type IVb pilin n=1 Tax=Vibrio gallaecicus TaxID=552386 RepID=UPI0010C9A067|nr:Flp family type IVb pilin [Vibrio gallaecicus]MDN3615013.1 Flp family type IVb pilin [Vibrio gallaecicus]